MRERRIDGVGVVGSGEKRGVGDGEIGGRDREGSLAQYIHLDHEEIVDLRERHEVTVIPLELHVQLQQLGRPREMPRIVQRAIS